MRRVLRAADDKGATLPSGKCACRPKLFAAARQVTRRKSLEKINRDFFSDKAALATGDETFEPTKLPPDLAKIPAVKPGSK